jgi:hypothetical protein
MELTDLLTKDLGVNETQAQGGAGLILKLAKDQLAPDEYAKVAAAVPEIEKLLGAAPSGGGGLLGGFGKILGGEAGGLANTAGGFSKLGLNSSMVMKFIPIILQFVEGKGGANVKALLENALK